jgi:phospholipid N-methyltransferase
MTKEEVLQNCTIEGMVVKLPVGDQLDRKLYLQVKTAIEKIGGKWKGGKVFGFQFKEDPTNLMADISGGVKRDIKKEFQFCATQPKEADRVVSLAEIEEGHKVLEPSAGDGAIVKAVNRILPNMIVHCYEKMQLNKTELEKINTTKIIGEDFLTHGKEKFDRIVANPPFSNNQDIDHVRKMYDSLNKGGRLVSITSTHYINSNNNKETEFKDWLKEVGADLHEIKGGAFKKSGTNVKTMILVINKK